MKRLRVPVSRSVSDAVYGAAADNVPLLRHRRVQWIGFEVDNGSEYVTLNFDRGATDADAEHMSGWILGYEAALMDRRRR